MCERRHGSVWYWGIGHTLTLLAAGTLLVVLRAEMPALISDVLACAVVLLLVGFGCRAVYLSAGQARRPTHSHGSTERHRYHRRRSALDVVGDRCW